MRRLLLIVSMVTACGGKSNPGGDADGPPVEDVAPAFRNPVNLPDDQLAQQALSLLGASVPGARTSCNSCHGMTRQHLYYWRALSDDTMTSCLTDLTVATAESAKTMLDCLRSMPAVTTSDYSTERVGVFATAIDLPWFQYAIKKAYGADAAAAEQAKLATQVGMPRGATIPKYTQEEFDIVAEWFARGLPTLESSLIEDPPPSDCTAGISSQVSAHVNALKTTGWRAVNKTNLMAMHGCGAATDPKACLADKPFGSDQAYGTGWDVDSRGRLRVLADVTYSTSYWSRSSPDGRFIAHGVRNVPGSYVYDLQRNMTVGINTAYDPAFFPDGTGFVFQGGPRNTCGMSVLTSDPTTITMQETACADIQTIGLYQHVGRALGGDYFAIDSQFVSDDGGHAATLGDPATSFPGDSLAFFNPMVFDGAKYIGKPQVSIKTPFEGDIVLSPSARVILSRVSGPNDRQLGYVLRKVNATPAGSSYTIEAPEIARYCLSGGKPNFSYDERWIVYHHYVTSADAVELGFTGPTDPAFAPYLSQGAANVYLMDITTGVPVRVTNMKPGQYALFPHFRSDGWIYAQVRDPGANHEYMVASDAALIAEGQ